VEDKKVIAKMGFQTRDEAVECMCWARAGIAEGAEGEDESAEEGCSRVFSGRADGVVQLWDVQKHLEVSRMEPLSVAHEQPRSIFLLNRMPGAAARLVTCCENGAVGLRTLDDALENVTSETDITVKGPVSRMRGSHSGAKLAYGGKENELQLFDLATEKVEWTAKNVPQNFLDLRLPVWVTDIQFLRNSNDRKIAICTAYGQVSPNQSRYKP
jgi:WD40 repeat protein